MKVTLYFINFNDSYYLPFIAKHYSFCDRIVMCDNHSTDYSRRIAESLGFEVRLFGTKGVLNDQDYLNVKNKWYKGDKSDYVIVCDADEFLFTSKEELKGLKDKLITMPKVTGYNMVSDHLPEESLKEVSTGHLSENYSKSVIFNPRKVDINFVHGCHVNNATGQIRTGGDLKLYHYRMIGGIDRLLDRHKIYVKRMSSFNKRFKMGFHYLHSEEAKRSEWNELASKSKKLW